MRKRDGAWRVKGTRSPSSDSEPHSSSESYSRSSEGDREFETLRFTVIDERGVVVDFFDEASCREVFLDVIHDIESEKSIDLVWIDGQRWALVNHSWNYSDLPIPMARIIEPSKAAELILKRPDWQQRHQPFPRELEQFAIGARLSDDDPIEDVLRDQSLTLYRFLKTKSRRTPFDSLKPLKCWHGADPNNPSDDAITKALKRLRDILNKIPNCPVSLVIDGKDRRTYLVK